MTATSVTLGAGYFDGIYAAATDPWGFEERWCERRKYAISLAMLPLGRYRAAFEPGCSIGVFTRMLAPCCGALLSCDLAVAAVWTATERTVDLRQVRVEQRDIPGQWPSGRFDLIIRDLVLLRRPRPGAGPQARRRLAQAVRPSEPAA